MKKSIVAALVTVMALFALAGCSSNSASTDTEAESTDAAATAATEGVVVDEAAKTVTFSATATGFDAESSIHFLVNENGSNAEKAFFTTTATNHDLFDALESLGATHGDNIAVEDTGGTIEGSDLKIEIIVDGTSYAPNELVAGSDLRPDQPRFGGNIDLNDEYGTGCLFCMESCSLGITSNAAYEYCEPMEFAPTDNMPAAGTEVTVVYTVL